jgi:hypothetical protein
MRGGTIRGEFHLYGPPHCVSEFFSYNRVEMPLKPYPREGVGYAYLATVTAKGKEPRIPEPEVKGKGAYLLLDIV